MSADVLVAGAGPAGCAAAIELARAGASVVLLERDREPAAKVCGEFLSAQACDLARSLGVDPPALDAAPIDRMRLSWRGASAATALGFRAASVSRRAFDTALLAAARAAGVRVEAGAHVVGLTGTGAEVRRAGERVPFAARAVVLATGKSDVAGLGRRSPHVSPALGFKMHLELTAQQSARLGRTVELALFAHGYAGMQRIESGRVALAIVVRREAFVRIGSWRALVGTLLADCPPFAHRLRDARECWPKPLAVSGVPYGYVYGGPAPGTSDAVYRTGDQFAVIPSFTGDGIAIALRSGAQAARAIVRGDAVATYHASMRRELARPMRVADALARAVTTSAGRAAVVWPACIAPPLLQFAARATRLALL